MALTLGCCSSTVMPMVLRGKDPACRGSVPAVSLPAPLTSFLTWPTCLVPGGRGSCLQERPFSQTSHLCFLPGSFSRSASVFAPLCKRPLPSGLPCAHVQPWREQRASLGQKHSRENTSSLCRRATGCAGPPVLPSTSPGGSVKGTPAESEVRLRAQFRD